MVFWIDWIVYVVFLVLKMFSPSLTMGVPQSKPEERINHINRELSCLRSSLRISKSNLTQENRSSIVGNLADQSTEVKSFAGKVSKKKIDDTLKKIGDTMQEVLGQDGQINRNASETCTVDSEFTTRRNTSENSSTRSAKSTKSRKPPTAAEKQKRPSIPTLLDIEVKFYDIRPKIISAIEKQDTHLLRIYQETLKTIASDMEMIETIHDTPMDDLKRKLSNDFTCQYQKITKALKEFRRNDNLQYLSNQSKKTKALKELDDIELQLAQTESLMDKMAKDKNDVDFSTIRNNLIKTDQSLRSGDWIDDETKTKAVSLTKKFKEIVKNNESLMTKRDFDNNFSQSVQKLELLIDTFDANTDKNHFLTNLENLYESVEKLEEYNETAQNKKKHLLDEINKHIKNMRSYLRQNRESADGKIVQRIVEENVELRKKVKTSDEEHTVIDQFYNYWSNVKDNFNVNSYCNRSLLRLHRILEEMKSSIMDIQENIAEKCDLKNNLDKNYSQSMPRLTLNKHNSAYGSHKSLNQINEDNEIVRTKVKMYNISTPELLNAKQDFLDDKHENKRFSKIEEIKTQVNYIKEKINEDHNKNLLRDKLEHYLKTLNEFFRDSNKTVANNANIVASDIHILIHKLTLADIKEKLQVLVKRAERFQGNKFDKDFEEIRDHLINLQVTLENTPIPPQYKQLERDKNDMLDAIFHHIHSLENKVVYYQKNDENVKKIRARLVKAKEQIKIFTGVQKGLLYNNIERDLNKILMDLECIEDKSVATEITRDVDKYLNILQQKASKAESFKGSQDLATKPLSRVSSTSNFKEDLNNIRTDIDRTSDNDQNGLEGLKSRLDLVNLELGQISSRSNENLLKEKDIFTNEVETLRNVVEAKITLGQQPSLPLWPEPRNSGADLRKTDVTKEMENIYKKFEHIKDQVTKNHNLIFEEILYDLQQLLNELDKFRFIRNTDLDFQKLKLYNEIVYYRDELENNHTEEQTLSKAEKILKQIENVLNSNKSVDFVKMTEDIQEVQKKITSLKHNHSLRERKISCEVKSGELVQQIKSLQDKRKNDELAKTQSAKSTLNDIEEKLKTLKPEVNSFVGVKTDNRFYELDETMTRLILDLDRLIITEITLKKQKIALLKELHQQGKVLGERASQTEDVVYLEKKLEKVSNITKEFSGSNEDYKQIKALMEELGKRVRSLRCNNDLVLRKNACVEKFSVLFNKVLAMGNSLETKPNPTEPVNTKAVKGTTSQTFNFLDRPSPNDILEQVEKQINDCKPKIEAFCNVQQSVEFQEIDDILTKCTMKLNKIETPRNTALDKKKMDLMQLIEDFVVCLEIKAENAEIISQVEETLKAIGDQMNSPFTHDIIDRLDEALIEMQIKLGKIDNVELKPRKDVCMMSIILYAGQINEYKQLARSTAV